MVASVNQLFGILVIGSQILVLAVFISSLLSKNIRLDIFKFLSSHALKLAFFVSLTATLGSLFYSDVAGFDPCKLCWYQRIFMYPQTVLLGLAQLKKDKNIIDYSLALSIFGFLIASYHYLMQIGWVPALNCAAIGYSASCSKEFVLQFGYITIPMMAMTAFSLIILLLGSTKLKNK